MQINVHLSVFYVFLVSVFFYSTASVSMHVFHLCSVSQFSERNTSDYIK